MKNNLVGVMYIGSKPEKTDNVANTGAKWVPGQTINFPMDVARKLLVHTNVWELVEVDPDGETYMGGKKSPANTAEPVPFININEMDVKALAAFARVEFNQSIDPTTSVEAARTLVLGFMTNASLDAEASRLTSLKTDKHHIGIEVGEEEYKAYLVGDLILKLVPKPAEGAQIGGLMKPSTEFNLEAAQKSTLAPTGGGGGGGLSSVKPTREELDADLTELPGDYTADDADSVVTSMRTYFGELFTDEDEVKVRAALNPAVAPDGNQEANAANSDPLASLKADLAKLDKKALRELCVKSGLKVANTMTEEMFRQKLIDAATPEAE